MTINPKFVYTGLLALCFSACSPAAAKDAPAQDPATPAAEAPPAAAPVPQTASRERRTQPDRIVESGTQIEANLQEGFSSRTNRAGETLHAVVSANVLDAHGRTMIPAGSIVTLSIVELEPSRDR